MLVAVILDFIGTLKEEQKMSRLIRFLAIGVVALCWMGSGVPVSGEEKVAIEKVVLDLGGVKMEFVRIKAGKFTMGSKDRDQETPHEVTISKDYWMQTTETTQGQWEAVMGTNPSTFKGADLPVEDVNWEDCQEFLKKLNEKAKEQLKGKTAKLPTEAEWEYACRAGENGKWCFGDDENKLGDYAWYEMTARHQTHPVGQKKPNAWGLYDMPGNVWEWCEDWYGEKYPSEAVTDPTGPATGDDRCLRGGCWKGIDGGTRSADRHRKPPTLRSYYNGLRVALR